MIMELLLIIICEIIVLLAILIVYCADYTNSYIHCHCKTEPNRTANDITEILGLNLSEILSEKVCQHYHELGKKKLPKEFEDD